MSSKALKKNKTNQEPFPPARASMHSEPKTLAIETITQNLQYTSKGYWQAQNQHAISYPAHQNQNKFEIEERSFWFNHRNACLLHALSNHPPASTFFDIGGGNGYVAAAIQKSGIETALVEPGLQGIRNALTRGIQHTIWASFEQAGFKPDTLPAAGLFDVLEHIEDDFEFLRQIHQKLALGGKLYLTVPAYAWLWSAVDEFDGHYRRYTLETLTELLQKVGFSITYSTYFFSFLIPPIFFLRSIPSTLKFRRANHIENTKSEDCMNPHIEQVLKPVMRWECNRIQSNQTIPFGTSCLCIASRSNA